MSRYHRQMILPQVGEAGQERLGNAMVLVAGCGALGCSIADLLARAGVGRIRIVDRDLVESTNLQRQVLFSEQDVGLPKATAAASRLRAINSDIELDPHVTDINPSSIRELAAGCDVIVDGLDNFETRYLLNDLAVCEGIPYVYGGAVGTEGLSLTVMPSNTDATACLRCIFPEPPSPGTMSTCDTAGILGPIIAMVAAHQAMQVMKLLLDCPGDLDRSLVSFDAWRNEIRRLAPPSPVESCPCCSLRRFDWLDGTRSSNTTMLCGRGAVQVLPGKQPGIALVDLSHRLSKHGDFTCQDGVLRGALKEERGEAGHPVELTVFEDLRALVGQIESTERAKAIYDRYVGA